MAVPTLDDIKEFVRSSLTGVEDAIITNSTDAAIRLVEEQCQRKFTVASTSTARVFRPDVGTDVLRIHDCTSVTSVVENGTTLTVSTDYQLEPFNGLSWSGHTVPYEQIRRLDACWYTDGPRATVTITAAWGWLEIPAPVVEAMKVLAKDIADHRDVKFGLAGFTEYGGVRTRQAAIITDLTANFRRVESWGIA